MRVRLAVLCAVIVAALSVAASAVAGTGYGYAGYSFGGACDGCSVQIHDYATGANGSTIAWGGTYSFSGLVGSHDYGVIIYTCKVHSHYSSPWSFFHGYETNLPSLFASADGGC